MNAHNTGAPIAHVSDLVNHWNELVRRYEESEAAEGDGTDETIDLAGELIRAVMEVPAPDAAALRWKLDYLLGAPEGSGSYVADFLTQTVADYRRILGSDENVEAPAKLREERYVRSPFRQAHANYRYAKAAWDAEIYLPEREGADVPEEINTPLDRAHYAATIALMIAPVTSLIELQEKLEVYRDESLETWGEGNKLTDALIADAERLAAEARNV